LSALRSPTRPRAPERDQVAADQPVEDFVQFWRAGEPAKGWFRCADCGFGAATLSRLPLCARCQGRFWERAETSPFETGPPPPRLDADLPASLGAMLLAVALLAVLWTGLAGLAFGLFRLIHG
jgi:hypothetical protein